MAIWAVDDGEDDHIVDGGDMAMLVAVIMPAAGVGTTFPVPPSRMGRPAIFESEKLDNRAAGGALV